MSTVFSSFPEVVVLGECPPRKAWTVPRYQSARASLPLRRTAPTAGKSSTAPVARRVSESRSVHSRSASPSTLSWYVSGVLAMLLVGVMWARHGSSASTPTQKPTPADTLRVEAPVLLEVGSVHGVLASR